MTKKKTPKQRRDIHILIGLVELYLKTGKPVGSDTLQASHFQDISPSTIRNHFAKLEASGFLKQSHSSAGRIPTDAAFKLYAMEHIDAGKLDKKQEAFLKGRLIGETKEIAAYLGYAAEVISEATGCACFISSPRFDQDIITKIRLLEIDSSRLLCVILTDFGLIHTETLYSPKKLSTEAIAEIETYFAYRLGGGVEPALEELELAKSFYNEIMLRHIAGYANFHAEDITKTGFSKLLAYPDLQEATRLAGGLSLFEDPAEMRRLLRESMSLGDLKCWIGDDLSSDGGCAVFAIPYAIQGKVVGSIGILGPTRIAYPKIFQTLRFAAKAVSENLTQNLVKFQITFREPSFAKATPLDMGGQLLLENHGERS